MLRRTLTQQNIDATLSQQLLNARTTQQLLSAQLSQQILSAENLTLASMPVENQHLVNADAINDVVMN